MFKNGNYILYKEHMNLRCEPKSTSKAIGVIPRGSCINVTEVWDNWGKTEYMGTEGWCCISECFAKPSCSCEAEECCYFDVYMKLENKYNELILKIDKIKDILK